MMPFLLVLPLSPYRVMRIIYYVLTPKTLLCALCLLISSTLHAEATTSLEYKIKAAYLYNFTKFITWIKDDARTFNLCILGNDPFNNVIDPIEKRSVSGRPIKLIRSNHFSNLPHCHIIYLGKNAPAIHALHNTLLVCEQSDFEPKKGMINFIQKNDTIRLQINLDTLKHSGLQISAKLLEVAETIIQEDEHD